MATEGNGGLGSSKEVQEGQLMDLALERAAVFLMDDSIPNPWSALEPYIRRIAREENEVFAKPSRALVGGSSTVLYMIAGQKRVSDSSNVGEGEQQQFKKQKAPARPSEKFEVHTVDTQKKLETCLGRIESLETLVLELSSKFERGVPKIVPDMDGGREQIQELDRRNLQLHFQSSLPDSFFTGKKVKGLGDAPICVQLIDTNTRKVVQSGSLSSLKLLVVPLEGDFENEDGDWTQEKFDRHVVKQRTGKPPPLTGDLEVSLKEGEGSLGEFKFADNSISMRSGKFRLGVKVASSLCEGIRVREGITDAFKVKDRRGESYGKHDLPTLDDDVWRLKKIGKNGAFQKRLDSNGISKVKDFLWLLGIDAQRLRQILGSKMHDKMWDALEKHAKTCVPSGQYRVYYANNTKNSGVVFTYMSEFCGLIEGGKYYSAETLSDSKKVFADTLKKEAYAKWKDHVDGLLLLEMNPSIRARSSQTDIGAPESCPFDIDQQVSPALLTHVAPQPCLVNPGLAVGAPISCQPPSVPSGEASGNSMPAIEDCFSPSWLALYTDREQVGGINEEGA